MAQKKSFMTTIALLSVVAALAMLAYLVRESKALTYLSDDAEACINCHTMNTFYETWRHSSHFAYAKCVDCHLPQNGDSRETLMFKAKDGLRHAKAMTLKTYGANMRMTDEAAAVVQDNCIRCHAELVSQMLDNSKLYARKADGTVNMGRRCWECHRGVPHDMMSNINATQNNFVKPVTN